MFDPRNILVIDFGQLGDVVMSLPALQAIRKRFPEARITVAVGKPGAEIVELSGHANETIVVDRVALRDGFKPFSVLKLINLVKQVRRAQYDFVVDLHSLYETNVLGFLSGAPKRLYSRRPGRSLDYLANFHPRPPREDNSPESHLIDRYLSVLQPLGVKDQPRTPHLETRPTDNRVVEKLLKKEKVGGGVPLVGLFPGAGHPGRRWPLDRFAELADRLTRNQRARVIVFAGPEEGDLIRQMKTLFPRSTIIFNSLTIPQLAAAQARLSVFVSNDTGPMHIAAAVGTSVVMLSDRPTPHSFIPQQQHHRIVYGARVSELSIEEVYSVTCQVLATRRTEALFSR
ncbi:MAG TPA: glycosyltransferase family 9 protein [Pyrinomonadaceae bacterium]|nr:glycosyltransferase family 9 protein [Pyrinomonadaceae bacterium]